jgi:glutathione S-transferase
MHLISLPVSPFAARVRIAIYAKELKIEVRPPARGWPRNPQFRDVNPTGRVPVLILADGESIWESAVILEFLEEYFPEARPLLPSDLRARAKARLLVRHADLYLMPPMVLLAQPQQNEREAHRLVQQLVEGLAILDGLLAGRAYAVGNKLSFADCALAPALFAANITGARIGVNLINGTRRVTAYTDFVRRDEHVAQVLQEMEEGLRLLSLNS